MPDDLEDDFVPDESTALSDDDHAVALDDAGYFSEQDQPAPLPVTTTKKRKRREKEKAKKAHLPSLYLSTLTVY